MRLLIIILLFPFTVFAQKVINQSTVIGLVDSLASKMRRVDSTIYQTKYRGDTARNNIYPAIAAKGNGTVTSIATSNGVTGGTITGTGTISGINAAADGSTKGVASFTGSDFDASSGNISIDYTNGQAASGSNKGFLTSTDWTTFNNKGTVTSVARTNGLGIIASVANSTTTPNLTIAVDTSDISIASRQRMAATYVPKSCCIDSPEHAYAGTPAWTAGTAPSSPVALTYRWTKKFTEVHVRFDLVYGVAGATVTQVILPWPADLPIPEIPSGRAGNNPTGIGTSGATTLINSIPVTGARPSTIKFSAGVPTLLCMYTSASTLTFFADITYYVP